MFNHFKKLLKKSLGLNDRHPFDEKKTRAPSNEIENEAKEHSKNTNNKEPDQRRTRIQTKVQIPYSFSINLMPALLQVYKEK